MLWGMKIRNILLFLLIPIIIGGLLFYGYNNLIKENKSEVSDKEKKEDKDTEEPEVVEPPKLKIIDEDSNTRPIGIMVDNEKDARPHGGLQDAYLVYEIIIEWGQTRYFALFKDKPDTIVGPNRSARHYFLDYALENDAIFTHFGFSPQAIKDIDTLNIDNLSGTRADGAAFWRVPPLGTYHNVFTQISKLMNKAKDHKYRLTSDKPPLIAYSIEPVNLNTYEDAKTANYIKIVYSKYHNVEYKYNTEDKVYERYMRGTAHYDRYTNKQYTVKNIIVYSLKNYDLGQNKGRQQLDRIGTGKGYYITEGYAIPITWEKTARAARTTYKNSKGEEIKLNDGNTFIQIQPLNQTLTIE